MKLAVTYDNGMIFQHFGHTAQFKVYDIEDNTVVSASILDAGGSGHGALATLLADNGIKVLICGGIGGGAQTALTNAGIQLFGGVTGEADAAVDALLGGKLRWNPDVKCNHHHDHGEGGHTCGNHTCGNH